MFKYLHRRTIHRILGDSLCAEMYGPKLMRVVRCPKPAIGPNDVLLKMGIVCISDNDLVLESKGRIGSKYISNAHIPGSQGCGMVIERGKDVPFLKTGDRVVINSMVSCGVCDFCRSSKEDLCVLDRIAGFPPDKGSLSTFFKHPGNFCHKIPQNMGMFEASLTTTLARCLKVYTEAKIHSGSNMLILGCGKLAQTMIVLAKALGVGKIVVTDQSSERVVQAEALGADFTLVHDHLDPPDPAFSRVNLELLQDSPDVTVDTICLKRSIEDAFLATKEEGVVLLMKMPYTVGALNFNEMILKRLTFSAPLRCGSYFKSAFELMKRGVVSLKHIKPVFFPLHEAQTAFQRAHKIQDAAEVSVVQCSDLE